MLERGFKFRLQPLLAMFTNSGSDRNSYCYEEHEHAVRVAAGTMTPDEPSAYVGEIDRRHDLRLRLRAGSGRRSAQGPELLGQGQPAAGRHPQPRVPGRRRRPGQGDAGQAQRHPAAALLRLDRRRPGLDQPRERWSRCSPISTRAEHKGRPVNLGLDLSGTKDLTALAHVVQTGTVERTREEDGSTVQLPTFDAWIEAWTPGDTAEQRALEDSAPYEVWIRQGFLRGPPGKQVRFDYVAAYVAGFNAEHDVRSWPTTATPSAASRRSWRLLHSRSCRPSTRRAASAGAKPTEDQVDLGQGARPAAARRPLDAGLAQCARGADPRRPDPAAPKPGAGQRLHVRRGRPRPFENRWFDKQKATQRIDPIVALAMAVGAALAQGLERQKSFWQ
jgi:hypothetical protein